jgi:hypothetical protein
VVLLRQVKESAILLEHVEQPFTALRTFIEQVLNSDCRLQELVRESDVEWGRAYGERPHFQKEGSPPHQDDPYTIDSVRATLSTLVKKLTEEASTAKGQ